MNKEVRKSAWPEWISLSFFIELLFLLVTVGTTYGFLKAEVSADSDQLKNLPTVYMRIDVYEARHKALEDKIDSMAKSVEEIKSYVLSGKLK